MKSISGVYNILSTPFTAEGSVDEDSLRRLTDATIKMGVSGITILGVAGEAQKLTDAERQRLIEVVMDVNAGRVPIVVGTTRDGTDATIAACLEAEAAGAAGFMIAPPTFSQAGPALIEHFRRIGEAISVPITLQDFPAVNGVTLSPRAMADLVEAVPAIRTIKLEDTPTPQRILQTNALVGDRASIVGGLGGMYLLDELRCGGSGTMTGFAYPEVLIQIWNAWRDRQPQAAAESYYRYLPLLVFEGQPKIGVAIRKETLRRRSLINNADLRHPGLKIDPATADHLGETLAYLEIDKTFPIPV